jgi:hypothetical protein
MLTGIIDWFKGLIDNIKERIQNPFGEDTSTAFAGAFVAAFIIKHWKLVYSLFYFDDAETRTGRIRIIEEFLKCENFWTLFIYPSLYAVIALSLYYLVNNLALFISLVLRDYVKGWNTLAFG